MDRLDRSPNPLNITGIICKRPVNLGKTCRREHDIGKRRCLGLEKLLHDDKIFAFENARILQTSADKQRL